MRKRHWQLMDMSLWVTIIYLIASHNVIDVISGTLGGLTAIISMVSAYNGHKRGDRDLVFDTVKIAVGLTVILAICFFMA